MASATRHHAPLLARIGVRVRHARIAKGLTQEELAARALMSRPSIANLEGGNQDMPITRLWLIAWLLDTDLASLVAEDGSDG